MPTVTKAADRHTAVTTGWTNPANAYATTGDNTYATAVPGKNSTVNGDFGWPAFSDAEIPVGSTINSVTVTVEWGMTAAVTGGTLGVQGRNNNVTDSAAEITKTTTTEAQSTFVFGTVPSITDLKTAGRVVARIRAAKGNTTNAMTANLDFVSITVNYTLPGNWTAITGGKVGPDGATTHTGRSITLGAVAVGDLIVANMQHSGQDANSDTLTDDLGNTYTLLGYTNDATDNQCASWWYCIVTTAGSPTLTSTYAVTHPYDSLIAEAYHCSTAGTIVLDQTSQTNTTTPATSGASGANNVSFGPITPNVDDALIIGIANNLSGVANFTAGTSPIAFTADQIATPSVAGADAAIEHYEQTTAASISATFGLAESSIKVAGGVFSFIISSSTPKSDTDSGSGVTNNSTLTAAETGTDANGTTTENTTPTKGVTDANGTVTEAAAITAPVSASDANGTTTEVASIVVQITTTDTNGTTTEVTTPRVIQTQDSNGTTTETGTPKAVLTGTDVNGATTEAQTISVPVSATDSNGATTEAASFSYTASTSDSNGTTTEILLLRLSGADQNSTTTENTVETYSASSSDANGTTTETQSTGAPVSSSDSNGATTETGLVAFNTTSTDSGSGAESASFTYSAQSSDSGAGSEIQTIRIVVSDTNGTTTESQSALVIYTVTDTNGTTTENTTTNTPKSDTESGAGSDVISALKVVESASDSGTSTEIGTYVGKFTTSDSNGTTTEAGVLSLFQTGSDSGSSTQAQSLTAALSGSDAASGIDTGGTGTNPSSTDTGSGAETGTPKANVSDPDSGTASENASIPKISWLGTDGGIATENFTLQGVVSSADISTGVDDQTVNRFGALAAGTDRILLGTEVSEPTLTGVNQPEDVILVSAKPSTAILTKAE